MSTIAPPVHYSGDTRWSGRKINWRSTNQLFTIIINFSPGSLILCNWFSCTLNFSLFFFFNLIRVYAWHDVDYYCNLITHFDEYASCRHVLPTPLRRVISITENNYIAFIVTARCNIICFHYAFFFFRFESC